MAEPIAELDEAVDVDDEVTSRQRSAHSQQTSGKSRPVSGVSSMQTMDIDKELQNVLDEDDDAATGIESGCVIDSDLYCSILFQPARLPLS